MDYQGEAPPAYSPPYLVMHPNSVTRLVEIGAAVADGNNRVRLVEHSEVPPFMVGTLVYHSFVTA